MSPTPNIQPPKFFLRFFRWFCDPSFSEDIEGDLMEMLQRDMAAGGKRNARIRFSVNVIRLFRPGVIRKFGLQSFHTRSQNPVTIFQSNLRTGFRHLSKRKLYSTINIFGLAISIAACLVLWTYVRFELTYDGFHPNAGRVYRVNTSFYAVNVNAF